MRELPQVTEEIKERIRGIREELQEGAQLPPEAAEALRVELSIREYVMCRLLRCVLPVAM